MPEECPRWWELIIFSIQNACGMLGASIIVPKALGVQASIFLFANGLSTLFFVWRTRGKVPTFLGSSFAYIAPAALITNTPGLGYEYALGGFCFSGIFFFILALLVKNVKTDKTVWLNKYIPTAAMGAVVIMIGLELLIITVNGWRTALSPTGNGEVSTIYIAIAAITFFIAFIGRISKGFWGSISVLVAILVGYAISVVAGIVNFEPVTSAPILTIPNFVFPKFSPQAIITIMPSTIVVFFEHISHMVVTQEIIKRNIIDDEPGLYKTASSDAITTMLASLIGAGPSTTYAEIISLLKTTMVYSVYVSAGAGIISIIMSLNGQTAALIETIPSPVMFGIGCYLYATIAMSGYQLLITKKVDYSKPRNWVLTFGTLFAGLFAPALVIGVVEIKGMGLAAIAAICLGVFFLLIDKISGDNDTESKIATS